MQRREILKAAGVLGLAPWTPGKGVGAPGPASDHIKRARVVLEAARSFGRGGGYDKSWKSTGCPKTLSHGGDVILSGSDKGTYCCGFTFAVAVESLERAGALDSKSAVELKAFQKVWFGATSDSEEQEKQCALAVEQLGVGASVPMDEAMAGDFAQLWRRGDKPSGHSILFLGWLEVGDERIGLSYLSSQSSTGGIGYGVEYFSDAEAGAGRVDRDRIYFARLRV
jgi:hypothetical protein